MRRLASSLRRHIAASVLGLFLVACAITGTSLHNGFGSSMAGSTNCSSACSSLGQLVAINNQLQQEEDDEKEPAPPAVPWPTSTANLALLYVIPVVSAVWVLTQQKERLLSTQMRF